MSNASSSAVLKAVDVKTDKPDFIRKEFKPKNHYFDNEVVEGLMYKYLESACTDVSLRDQIMEQAEELIRQIIKAHNLGQIYPGRDEASIGDLFQTCWVQIESALYKYEARPHCSECYNQLRPTDSILSEEFIFADELLKKISRCPHCKIKLTREGLYYKGKSRVFNHWCVSPDTLLFTPDGIKKIEDCIPKTQYSAVSFKTSGFGGINDVTAFMRRPKAITLKIKVAQHYEFECTPEHEIFVLDENGIKKIPARECEIGNLLAVQYKQDLFGNHDDIDFVPSSPSHSGWIPPKKWTRDLAYFVGLVISEGSITTRGVIICNTDIEVKKFLKTNKLGLNFRFEGKVKNICSSTRIVEFLKWLSLGTHAYNKQIPYKLLSCSKPIIMAMLQGMFDGDGHSSRHGGFVGYTSISKELIDRLRILLLNFGIITKTSTDKRPLSYFDIDGHQYSSEKQLSYQLLMNSECSKLFYDTIGFRIRRKQLKSNKLTKNFRFTMPAPIMIALKEMISKSLIQKTTIDKRTKSVVRKNGLQIHNMIKGKYITRDFLKAILDAYCHMDNTNEYKYLYERLTESSNIIWLPIINVEKSESETIDIEVPKTHSFTANGIIVSNSQVARTVALAYIKKENRDRKNGPVFQTHLEHKEPIKSFVLERFLLEAKDICKFNKEHVCLIKYIEQLYMEDEKPYEGLISKLVDRSGMSRAAVTDFLKMIRLRSHDFTDSPVNEENETRGKVTEDKNDGYSEIDG